MTFNEWLQSRLTAHGFACGPIDGIIGSLTTMALRAFQTARGLPATGTATGDTIAALRLPSSTLPNGATRPVAGPVMRPEPRPRVWPEYGQCTAFYGAVGTGQTLLPLPYPMRLAWARDTIVTRMTLHAKVAPSAGRVFEKIAETYAPHERVALGLDIFGGSLNVRRMRGGTSYSTHSWGIAIDFDPERNQLSWSRERARLAHPDAIPFWEAWEAEGWLSLGRERNYDWMHVQACEL